MVTVMIQGKRRSPRANRAARPRVKAASAAAIAIHQSGQASDPLELGGGRASLAAAVRTSATMRR